MPLKISDLFKRHDHVEFKGDGINRAIADTWVWAADAHDEYDAVIIEHPDGAPKGMFNVQTTKGKEAHRLLQTGLRYIYVTNESLLEKIQS